MTDQSTLPFLEVSRDEIIEATAENKSFSQILPGLQTAVDSTSLSNFKLCPRFYLYTNIIGYQPRATSFHLIFGLLYHGALERYDHKRSEGQGHEEALDFCIDWALRNTWNKELNRPWVSGDSNKNRLTLIRTIIDYLDKFGENDSLKTIQLANGKPAVELSFSFHSGMTSRATNEPFLFCGHLDRLAKFNDEVYVSDRKTTGHTISQQWFAQFTPHNQFSMYTLAGQIVWHEPIKGLIVDGAQIAVNFTRFARGVVTRDQEQLKEWHRDSIMQLELMEKYAEIGYWPQNDSSCDKYGGCRFREICGKSPQNRQRWLKADFGKRVWDPLTRRGDI